jgi:hypothetical protein
MRLAVAGLALALMSTTVGAACSTDDGTGSIDGGSAADTANDAATTETADPPDGPAAVLAPLDGGEGPFIGTAGGGPDLDEAGYEEVEYSASGTAVSYTADGDLPADGMFELAPGEEADYATRILVRRPAEADAFNGTVVVEWLNVSGGVDAAPDYTYLAEELVRGGYAWVGVSAQRIGVEGGTIAVEAPGAEDQGAGSGLVGIDPERYGDLEHPGDAFAYDIYTQVARALRSPGDVDALDGLDAERILAAGESQSAFALTTYINGVQPLARQYDGFLVHSRGGPAFPLGEPGGGIDIASAIGGPPTVLRTDGEAPIMVVETEGDVVGLLSYLPARQPDTDRFRLWEIAGTAHADKFQVGDTEEMLGCAAPINQGQQVFVLRAALRHLDAWVADGTAPPEAPRLDVDESGDAPVFEVDEVGNVTGGIRTPAVDAPVDVLSGANDDESIICVLFGSTTPIPAEELTRLYDGPEDYLDAYEEATDEVIELGFALEDDRAALLDDAEPGRLAG